MNLLGIHWSPSRAVLVSINPEVWVDFDGDTQSAWRFGDEVAARVGGVCALVRFPRDFWLPVGSLYGDEAHA